MIRHEIRKEYYTNGALFKEYGVDVASDGTETMSGISIVWYPSGIKTSEAFLENDEPHGAVRAWFPDGQLARVSFYSHGQKTGKKETWYSTGDPSSQINYIEGVKHGEQLEWLTPQGPLDRRIFDRGIETTGGVRREIQQESKQYPNGKLQYSEDYYISSDGRRIRHGTYIQGREDGSRIEIPYRDGVIFGRGCELNAAFETIREFVVVDGKFIEFDFDKYEW